MTQEPKFAPATTWIGSCCTLWWNDDFPLIDAGISFEQCIDEMALVGFRGCSIGHKYPTDPAVLQAALKRRDLRVSEPWVSTFFTINEMKQQTLKNVRQQLAFMDAVEKGWDDPRRADLVVAELGHAVHPQPVALFANAPTFDDRQWELLCDGLNEIGRLAHEAGRKLCYHPHLGTGVMIASAVDRLMAGTDPKLVHMLLDTAHLAAAEVDPLAVTKKHAKRIKHLHLKNIREAPVRKMWDDHLSFQQGVELGIFTVPGDPEGAITTFPDIIDELVKGDFAGWIMVEAEQDPRKRLPLDYAKMARAYFRELVGL